MGVHGLWELLAPVGHRVSNDSVRNKVLAVDVSIWLTQFVKAMRDAEGAQVRNGHLLGVFRRCVKLLYLSVKPILVFDGATPALKRRTLSSRRAQREKHAAKLRRLAEKMLLNQVKRRSVDHAIAKKRKSKSRKSPTTKPDDMSSLSTHSKHPTPDRETRAPNHQHGVSPGAFSVSPKQSRENRTKVQDTLPGGFVDSTFSDDPHEKADTDEMQISLPTNVDDLDDEVLMKLPLKLQSEVFKQVKLEQRARHRENMMEKQQRPSEFSKMQIEGFLRHTALNRKISRVRNVLNAKSGASRRIASDSRRGFLLKEDILSKEHGTSIGGLESEDEGGEIYSPGAKGEQGMRPDLLADIRARKEAFRSRSENITHEQTGSLKKRPQRESGNDWASKVLQGYGSLDMTRDRQSGLHVEGGYQSMYLANTESRHCAEEQPLANGNPINSSSVRANRKEENTDEEDSDDEEWEDGNELIGHDLNKSSRGEGEEEVVSVLGEQLELPASNAILAKGLSEHKHWGSSFNESRKVTEKITAAKWIDQRSENASFATVLRHGKVETDGHSEEILPCLTGNDNEQDSRRRCKGSSVSLRESPKREQTAEDHEQTANLHSIDSAGSPRKSFDGLCKGKQRELLMLQSKHHTMGPAYSGVYEKETKFGERATHDGTSCKSETDWQTHELQGHEILAERDAVGSTPGNPIISKEVREGDDALAGIDGCNRKRHSDYLTPRSQAQSAKGKNPKGSSIKKRGRQWSKEQPSELFGGDEKWKTEASGAPGENCGRAHTPLAVMVPAVDGDDASVRDALNETEMQEPSVAELETMQRQLEAEAREIDNQRSTYRGGAETVADEMYSETRDLIKLLGIPYLEAPMEAEAQCAFLNKENVVDGVLTEDSDAFLFGAVTVYRQLFAEGRFAEAYEAKDIKQNLGLDQSKLIRLAYLLGSDYTSGVRGVGIVNSMEILEAFPGSSGLTEFRDWMMSVTVLDAEPEKEIFSSKSSDAVRRRFCWKHRNMKRNWEVREGFPNPAVFDAYKDPTVDKSKERFSWGRINFEGLARFCWDKFGWDNDKFVSAVGPLRQKLQDNSDLTQRRIDEFFRPHRFAKIRSERLQRAVQGMAGDLPAEMAATGTYGRGKRGAKPMARSGDEQALIDHKTDSDEA